MAQVPHRLHPAHRLRLLRGQRRPDPFHGGATQSHRGRGMGVLRDAEGGRCPCERRREHRLLPGGHQEAEADRPDGILDVPDAHRKVVRFRPRDARNRGNAVPRRSLRGPARKHPSLHDRVG